MNKTIALVFFSIIILSSQLSLAAGIEVQFIPDKGQFYLNEFVTGKLRISNSQSKGMLDISNYSSAGEELVFDVVKPGGDVVRFVERTNSGLHVAVRHIVLAPGEFVLRPVCFGIKGGQYLLDREGSYLISVGLCVRDNLTMSYSKVAAPSVKIKVDSVGDIPSDYFLMFSHLRDVCGVFQYGMMRFDLDDIWGLELGPYRASVLTFMMYQGWHMSMQQYLTDSPPIFKNFIDIYLEKVNEDVCREQVNGFWIYEGVNSMKRSERRRPFDKYLSGDIVFK